MNTAEVRFLDRIFGPPSSRYNELASMIVYFRIAGAAPPTPEVPWADLAVQNPSIPETLEARALATLINADASHEGGGKT